MLPKCRPDRRPFERVQFYVLLFCGIVFWTLPLYSAPALAEGLAKEGTNLHTPQPGEVLTFDIKVLGATAGVSTMRVGSPRKWHGKKVLPLLGQGKTTGFWRNIYSVDNRILSLVDPKTGLPYRTEMSVDMKDRHEDYKLNYQQKRGSLRGTKSKGQPLPTKVHQKVHRQTHDLMSWLYALRALQLQAGDKHTLHTYSGNYAYRVEFVAQTEEEIWTPLGFLRATRIEGHVQRMGNSSFKKTFTVWIGTDRYRTPVQLAFDFKMGQAQVVLRSIQRNTPVPSPGVVTSENDTP